MTETEFSRKVEEVLQQYEDIGWLWHVRVNSGQALRHGKRINLARAGTPDRMVCIGGRFVALEIKRPGGGKDKDLRKSQREMRKKIERAGGFWITLDSIDHLHNFITAAHESSERASEVLQRYLEATNG
jgi:hypothetical protein